MRTGWGRARRRRRGRRRGDEGSAPRKAKGCGDTEGTHGHPAPRERGWHLEGLGAQGTGWWHSARAGDTGSRRRALHICWLRRRRLSSPASRLLRIRAGTWPRDLFFFFFHFFFSPAKNTDLATPKGLGNQCHCHRAVAERALPSLSQTEKAKPRSDGPTVAHSGSVWLSCSLNSKPGG